MMWLVLKLEVTKCKEYQTHPYNTLFKGGGGAKNIKNLKSYRVKYC